MLSTETFGNTTKRSLTAVAREHSTSRVLSTRVRDYFRRLAEGETPDAAAREMDLDALDVMQVFYETAASAATRYATSPIRRMALGDLDRVRVHVFANPETPLPPPVVRYRLEVVVDVAAGPWDSYSTLGEFAASLPQATAEHGWDAPDHRLQVNAVTVVEATRIAD